MPTIEVSVGELLDKYSILEIKLDMFKDDPSKIQNVTHEIDFLEIQVKTYLKREEINKAYIDLKNINLAIWHGMERVWNLNATFDVQYAIVSAEVTELNKQRSYLKKEIDKLSGSIFSEEKSYF